MGWDGLSIPSNNGRGPQAGITRKPGIALWEGSREHKLDGNRSGTPQKAGGGGAMKKEKENQNRGRNTKRIGRIEERKREREEREKGKGKREKKREKRKKGTAKWQERGKQVQQGARLDVDLVGLEDSRAYGLWWY